jgi:hypothetical protein
LSLAASPDLAGVGGCWFAWAAASADLRLDRSCAELVAELFGVVAAVGPQLPWPALVALDQLVEQRQQVPLFVFVAGREAGRERRAARVD